MTELRKIWKRSMQDDVAATALKTVADTAQRPDFVVVVPERPTVPGRSLVLAACLMATFMAAIESTIVSTTLPTIVGDLGGFDLFSWVFTIFLLTQAVSIPIYGRLADMFGRKKVFFAGVGLFIAGAILCGFAWGMVPLICFRAIEGLGAGAVQPIAVTILGDSYTPSERAHVQGLVSSVFGVSAVVGPSLGAFLIQHVSWSVVFWVHVPIGLAAVVMVALFLHETAEPRRRSIDWIGALLTLVTAGSLILALVQGGRFTPLVLGSVLAISVLAGILLLAHESITPEPMLPLELWRHNRVIVVGSLGSCAAGAMMMGISAYLPAYVQGAMGFGPMAGGIVLGAMSVSWAAASLIGGRIMVRTSYRLVAVSGAITLVVGCAILIVAPPEAGPLVTALGSFVVGIGLGFCMSVFVVSIQAAVPWSQRGAATSSNMFMRFMGQVIGVSGCGAVLNATISRMDPSASRAMERMLDPAGRATLSPAEVAHLADIVTSGLHNAWLLAGLFSVLTLLFACLLPARLSPRSQTTMN
jgi:EmrB/QacA subfamily drug resistance transporter